MLKILSKELLFLVSAGTFNFSRRMEMTKIVSSLERDAARLVNSATMASDIRNLRFHYQYIFFDNDSQ